MKKLLFAVLMAFACVAQAVVYSLPWGPKPQFVDANGAPMSSGTLTFYAAGTVTPQNTYTDSTGNTANSNPITLNSRGETPNEVWLTSGATYKLVLKDSSGTTVWTVDNISGVNDVAAQTGSEWIASGLTPTFVSSTSFTVAGDQTSTLHVGRRLKTSNTGGTIYSTITASAFGAVTTVTVANDSGSLDSGLSSINYGITSASNPSIAPGMVHRKGAAVASASTTDIWSIVGDYAHVTGSITITSLGTAPYAGAQRTIIFDGALTLTHNATTLSLPGGLNIQTAANDRAVVRADTTANMVVVAYQRASGLPALGTSIPRSYLAGLGMSTAGSSATMTIAAGQATDSGNAVVMSLGSSLAKTTAAWAVGAAQGCLDTGAIANSTWYHFYVISRPDTGVVDVLCSTSASSPTMPTNYSYKRRIGSGKTNGSAQWVKFIQWGDTFQWDVPVLDVNVTNPGNTAVNRTLSVPTGLKVEAIFNARLDNAATAGSYAVEVSDPDITNPGVNVTATNPLASLGGGLQVATDVLIGQLRCVTNTSAEIRTMVNSADAATEITISTHGWIDRRGKDD